MKKITKFICLLLSFCIFSTLLCSCFGESVEIDIQELIEANSTRSLLENYKSINIKFDYGDGETYGYYVDSELGYYWDTSGYTEITFGDVQYGFDGYEYYRVFYAGEEPGTSMFEHVIIDKELLPAEEIIKCKQKGDTITLTTKITVEEMEKLGYEFAADQDGGYFFTKYTIDASTLAIKQMEERFVYEDGKRAAANIIDVYYDTERLDDAVALLENYNGASSLRTVTVVTDPNTSAERSYKMTLPINAYTVFALPEEYENGYTDRACTIAFEGDYETDKDLTVYVTK
ncbi:MAG: hypothetical protein J6C89_02015 [Clostridia bacterium]|nr:hypothetical protein [Clostridia bacterium]